MNTELAQALEKFRDECPDIGFSATGQVGTRSYRYATLPSILEAIEPTLKACGLLVIQTLTQTESIDPVPALTTAIIHIETGTDISSTVPLVLANQDPQSAGSAITYMRRYALVTALGLAPDEDDDAASSTLGSRLTPQETPAQRAARERHETRRHR